MAASKRKEADDHVCPAVEAYLMTYADMITALLVLFITLFAMGQIDISKFEKFKEGIARSGATPIDDGLLENGEGVFEHAIVRPEIISSPDDQDGPGGTGETAGNDGEEGAQQASQQAALREAQAQLASALQGVSLGSEVNLRVESRGLVITVVADNVLFAPGSASLSDEGKVLVDTLAGGLRDLPNPMTVEGHTDSRPISTARFPSNWELSVARASTVLRTFVDGHGIPARKLSAAGYADQRPLASNETVEGRTANRRVEIVVHMITPDPVPTFGEGA